MTIRSRIIDLLDRQSDKGVQTYGHYLDDAPDENFDWRLMAMEELIDLAQYQQKEIMRLEKALLELRDSRNDGRNQYPTEGNIIHE